MSKKGKRSAYVLCLAGLVSVVLVAFALRRPATERWSLWQLESGSPTRRHAAVETLGRLRSTKAVLPLARILGEVPRDDPLSQSSADALVQIGSPAVSALIDALEDAHNVDADRRAADALERIGAPAIPQLIEAWRHSSHRVRDAAAYVLGRLGKHSEPELIELLRDGSEEAVVYSAEALEHMDVIPIAAAETLAVALENLESESRVRVIRTLTRAEGVRWAQWLPALLPLLAHQDPQVREDAVMAFARRRVPAEAVSHIVRSLDDDAPGVRRAAVYAVIRAGTTASEAAPRLEEWINDSGLSGDLFLSVRALTEIGAGDRAVHVLIRAAKDPDPNVRRQSVEFLGVIGTGDSAPESIVPTLTTALHDDEASVRNASLHALGEIGEEAKPAAGAIMSFLRHPSSTMRKLAAETLVQVAPEADQLVRATVTAHEKGKPELFNASWEALRKMLETQPPRARR